MAEYNKQTVLGLTKTALAEADPSEGTLKIHNFGEAAISDLSEAHAYIRDLLKANTDIGSPLFLFTAGKEFQNLSDGEAKWVGLIPWFLSEKVTRTLTEEATDKLTEKESKRLELDENEIPLLRKLIRNTLIAAIHNALKTAREGKYMKIDFGLNGKDGSPKVSYNELKTLIESISNEEPDNQKALIRLLKELHVLSVDTNQEQVSEILGDINEARRVAYNIYTGELGGAVSEAQDLAEIPGERAEIDMKEELKWMDFFELLKGTFGVGRKVSKGGKEEYELQTIGHLTNLMLRIERHPAIKTFKAKGSQLNTGIYERLYKTSGVFSLAEKKRRIFFSKTGSSVNSETDEGSYRDLEVYDTNIEGFDDLEPEIKQVFRGGFRMKEPIPLLIKTLIKKTEISRVHDLNAGEGVFIGIKEEDLDETKNPKAKRIKAFIAAVGEKTVQNLYPGLQRAPEGCHYTKLPRGTYKIEPKLQGDPTNDHTFGFPGFKIYANIPVTDPENPEDEEQSIRTEFRWICGDTYLRGKYDKNSMSHHNHYKRKQALTLLETISARAGNAQIFEVINKFKNWSREKEQAELKRRKS